MASNADLVFMANSIYAPVGDDRIAPDGWVLHSRVGDEDTSSLQAQAFINHASGEIVFAFAGTNNLDFEGSSDAGR